MNLKIFLVCLVSSCWLSLNAQLSIALAQCEKKVNPIGVPPKSISFGWQMTSKEKNQIQTAYQVVVASSREALLAGEYDIWNSGVVKDSASLFIRYRGKEILPAKKYHWKVRVWDKNNRVSAWSAENHFTTALKDPEDWKGARWIGYEELPDSMRVAPGAENPAAVGNKLKQRAVVPYFRKGFSIPRKIKHAIIFISGLGHYELTINGKKAADNFLTPGWSYYDKKSFYNVYDVTACLTLGSNVIGVLVGNGFYYINRERYVKMVAGFGLPKMICRMQIEYTDGTFENIVSDESWKTSQSPITYTSIYGGEDYDAQLEQPGWNRPGFADAYWKQAILVKAPAENLAPEQDYPVKIMDLFTVKKILKPTSGNYIYDFGQNLSGIIEIRVRGKKGQTVRLTPAELLNRQQLPNQGASGGPYYFTYTLKGDGVETWRPAFTYYGFRYVVVEGAMPDSLAQDDHPKLISLVSLHNRNSASGTGSFESSSILFNRINELIRWAIKSNMQSVITDCPHREKLSWLEQDHLMGNSIHYNYDIYHLYRKLVQDMIEAQLPNGLVPDIAPELVVFGGGFRDSPEWGSACAIVPWLLYTLYGDIGIIEQAYPMIKRYVAYLGSKSTDKIVSHGLGDWYDYGPRPPGVAQLTPRALTATAVYYYDVLLMQKMARLLEKKNDEEVYRNLGTEIRAGFNKKFFDPVKKLYATGSQTAMAMPLCLGLVEEQHRNQVLQNLVDSIYAGNKALTAGDVGFHYLVQALDEGGASQLLFDMINRDDVAGYGYQLKKGATALTESWAALEEVSNNHLMLGHIMEWFYTGLAGIGQEKSSIAFNHIKIRPQPVGNISSVKAQFHSPYGLIEADWKKENTSFFLKVTIPVNSTATIYLPASTSQIIKESGVVISKKRDIRVVGKSTETTMLRVGSGEYIFTIQ